MTFSWLCGEETLKRWLNFSGGRKRAAWRQQKMWTCCFCHRSFSPDLFTHASLCSITFLVPSHFTSAPLLSLLLRELTHVSSAPPPALNCCCCCSPPALWVCVCASKSSGSNTHTHTVRGVHTRLFQSRSNIWPAKWTLLYVLSGAAWTLITSQQRATKLGFSKKLQTLTCSNSFIIITPF